MEHTPQASTGQQAPDMRWFLFGLSGRIGRGPYILGILLLCAIYGVIFARLSVAPDNSAALSLWILALFAFTLASLWICVALSVKRLHDINIPGAVVVCLFVPAVSIVAFLVMCVWRGTHGPNDYGNSYNRPKS